MSAPEQTFNAAEIAAELRRIAALDSRSLPAHIEPSMFGATVALVEKYIVPGWDIEVSVLAALGKLHDVAHTEYFIPRKRKKRNMPC